MITNIPIPTCMRLVPTTGAVVLLDLPELPPEWRGHIRSDGRAQGERIEEARQALRRLSSAWVPGAVELSNAPTLEFEEVVPNKPFVCFRGRVFGHPKIPNGHRAWTSVVVGYDGRRGRWARTISRWYRLGPAPQEH